MFELGGQLPSLDYRGIEQNLRKKKYKMKVIAYKEITTTGSDPTQLQTWTCEDEQGVFTVTQFFGDYLLKRAGDQTKEAPAEVVDMCRESVGELGDDDEDAPMVRWRP
jgi:hypothetical protein